MTAQRCSPHRICRQPRKSCENEMQPAKRKRSTKSKPLDIPVEASFFSRLAGAARHKRHDVQEKLFHLEAMQPTLARHGSDPSVSCPTVEKCSPPDHCFVTYVAAQPKNV